MAHLSAEQRMPTEALPKNREPLDGYFGRFFELLRGGLASGGSELGLPMTLFSLAVSTRATQLVEIGRFKGLSTVALASALKFNDIGWDEPRQHKQRPGMDYAAFEAPRRRRLVSIDLCPTAEATEAIEQAGLSDYVLMVNERSDAVRLTSPIDILFIDGDHTYQGCSEDVLRYVPQVRPGGYFILHDYFGWYDAEGRNNSPIKRVIDELSPERFPRLLIDTGYQSFAVFRRPDPRIGA
ncbi:MAG TPA: class I SAM-dependent methyltransferase [Vicinamibacterales bacterium]|jgi:hypothetical protein